MNKYIFVDLDQTLMHGFQMHGHQSKPPYTQWDDYAAVVRPGALDLLVRLRSIAPTSMLTAASRDYARAWNEKFNLGFTNPEIFSRDDRSILEPLKWAPGTCYLIDDLPKGSAHVWRKMRFIEEIGELKYFRISPYYGFERQSLTKEMIDEISNFCRVEQPGISSSGS